MDYNDVCENIALLKAYFNAQGSIQKAADNLYIHKNTLQYRISKLKEITGLDVRKPTESPALYLAYIITDELINENMIYHYCYIIQNKNDIMCCVTFCY